MRSDGRWRFPLLLFVVGAHAWVGWELAHYHPAQWRERLAPSSPPEPEVVTVLEFKARPPAPANSKAPTHAATRRRRSQAPKEGDGPPDAGATGTREAGEPSSLDLRLGPPPKMTFRAPGPLQARVGLEFKSTRFDQAWLSDGDLKHVVAHKSVVAATILGALGALREPCTDRERRLSDPRCVPDQYHYPGPGEEP